MGRAPCCDKANVKKGPWSPEEDAKLKDFIDKYGTGGNWIALPQKAGLRRCGKSCRLRWLNYLRPNIKHGEFSEEEDRIICTLYATIGSRWSIIAAQLPGRTDNDIKNYWNTKLKKKLMGVTIPPTNQQRSKVSPFFSSSSSPLQAHHQSSLSSLSQLFKDCSPFYNTTPQHQAKSVTGLEVISSLSPNNLPLAMNHYSSCFQSAQDHHQGLMMNLGRNCPFKDNNNNNNMLMFGTAGNNNEAASCSSSDGSCSQMSYGGSKEIKQESMSWDLQHHQQGYDTIFSSSNGYQESEQKLMLDFYGGGTNGGGESLVTGAFDDDHHHLEEVKQLIISSSNNVISNNDDNNNISFYFNDENKTDDERTMYFY